jgi:hypothetical protein
MLRKLLSLLFALCLAHAAAAAQSQPPSTVRPYTIAHSQIVPIDSKHTGRKHELVVLLPASYAANPDKKYPVFYYLDAYWDTPLVAATYGNLIYDNQIPEMIMVGLSYPAGSNYDSERLLDYTPSAQAPGSGKAKAFLDFIRKEVAPLIEARYRGQSTDRVIGGSSLAGLFSIYAAYEAPDFFAGHIAISPAVLWDHQMLFRIDEAFATSKRPFNSRMFVSYGTLEHKIFREPIVRFQRRLNERAYAGLALRNHVMEGMDHAGVKGEGYARGLIWAWKAKKPAGLSGLDRAFNQ